MNSGIYNQLQIREVFHIEFLRWMAKKIKAECYALKGGTNLRLFFKSSRYSEDMDLDACGISVSGIKDVVMNILESQSFCDILRPFGVERVILPDITKAKQTQTTQRFKVHILTLAGEDLFTKIEFSRRGFDGGIVVRSVDDAVLRVYKLAPLAVPHYDIISAVAQKINALANRAIVQARDIFDLYILSSQYRPEKSWEAGIGKMEFKKACDNIFEISFENFRDTVISYLAQDDQAIYNSPSMWDEIKLKTSNFIEELQREDG